MRLCLRLIVTLACLGLVTVAAGATPERKPTPAACRLFFEQLNAATAANSVRDQGPYPIPGFPYLRQTRFLASFRADVNDVGRFGLWVAALGELDQTARTMELRNLPEAVRESFGDDIKKRLDVCRGRLISVDMNDPSRRRQLIHSTRVPDEYEGSWRLLGLYPLSALFVSLGVDHWHETARAQFNTVVATSEHTPVRWWRSVGNELAPQLTTAEVGRMLITSRDGLGIPRPGAADLNRLFAHFAPRWGVPVAGSVDMIGRPRWRGDRVVVDTWNPVEYHKVSYTRVGNRTLMQLNYIVWFPARSGDDIYAGAIDGLDWRLTIDDDGRPLMSDVIHNCGCYETFFTTPRLRLRHDRSLAYQELPLVFPVSAGEGRAEVLLASGNHLIHGVTWNRQHGAAHKLTVADYDELRSLPRDGGFQSMFGEHGIVRGSERRERFLLWPMGVRSPGAMRQWGRHAIAFVGRRHFDDPDLLENLFVYRK